MGLRELNNDQVHAVAAHLTVAEAIVQTGLPVELVVEQCRFRVKVGRRSLAQVFSRRSDSWQLSDAARPLAEDTAAVVFVNLRSSPAEYYPVPADWFRADVSTRYEEFLARHGRTRPLNPDSRHYAVQTSHIVRWLGAWDVLTDLAR